MKAIIVTLAVLLLASCNQERKATQIIIATSAGAVSYQVEIADNGVSRAQGLMNRGPLPLNAGMLFLYNGKTPVSFWMKNVSFPLDIIFFNEAGSVVKIHENALPNDLTPIQSEVPIIAVLELRGGTAKQDRINLHDMADISSLMTTR
ncbi:MAG: DUF192 domain-containing protein [Rhizobiaceae bacterium]